MLANFDFDISPVTTFKLCSVCASLPIFSKPAFHSRPCSTYRQGCIRPRPSPFQRPSTRYNGGSTPWRVVRLQDFGPRGGGSIAGFYDLRARSALNGAECAVLENFEDFFENVIKLMYIKSSEITFQGHFERTHVCVRTFKKSQIFARTFKINILASGRSILC